MPAELLKLNEQLANLQVLLDAATKAGKIEEVKKLHETILELQEKILARQEMLKNYTEQGF